ncbi:hypothetical protein [Vibrio nomapromontoriensis]|uniref:hypothetical protein n=1 Tax=Vibrio nomapromontoriensis TaxID=2910246 RepID=UPI003D129B2D
MNKRKLGKAIYGSLAALVALTPALGNSVGLADHSSHQNQLSLVNDELTSLGFQPQTSVEYATDTLKANEYLSHKSQKIGEYQNIQALLMDNLSAKIDVINVKPPRIDASKAGRVQGIRDTYQPHIYSYQASLNLAKKESDTCWALIWNLIAFGICKGIADQKVADYTALVNDTTKLMNDSISLAKADDERYEEIYSVQQQLKKQALNFVYGVHNSYVDALVTLESDKLTGMKKAADFYQTSVDADIVQLSKDEEKLRYDNSVAGVLETITKQVPMVSLIDSIPKIVGDVERIKQEVDRISSAADEDKANIFIEDFEELIGLPIVNGMRQIGLYIDPNKKQHKGVQFSVEKLNNIHDFQTIGKYADIADYAASDDPHVSNFNNNVEKLVNAYSTVIDTSDSIKATPWLYDNDLQVAYRLNQDTDIQCASNNGLNCLWGQGIDELNLRNLKPLTCGVDHSNKYGTNGYSSSSHWCNKLAKKSGAYEKLVSEPMWKFDKVQNVVYRINGNFDVECASYNGRDCLWGVPLSSVNIPALKPLACGDDHYRLHSNDGYIDKGHWCAQLFESSKSELETEVYRYNPHLAAAWFWPNYAGGHALRFLGSKLYCASADRQSCTRFTRNSDLASLYSHSFISLECHSPSLGSPASNQADCGIQFTKGDVAYHTIGQSTSKDNLRDPIHFVHPGNINEHLSRAHYRTLARHMMTHIMAGMSDKVKKYLYHDGSQLDYDLMAKLFIEVLDGERTTDQFKYFRPIMVDDKYLDGRPAALLYDKYSSYLVLNASMAQLEPAARFMHYLEELGSGMVWLQLCRGYETNEMRDCMGGLGDEGARFADAIGLYDLSAHEHGDNSDKFLFSLIDAPNYKQSSPLTLTFADNSLGFMEGYSAIDHYGDFVAGGKNGQTMAIVQVGLEVPSEYEALYEKFAGQLIYYAPRLKKKGDPTDTSDIAEDNVPTIWLQVALHDEINAFAGRVAGDAGSATVAEIADIGAVLIRNHGIELPFQKIDGRWSFQPEHILYYKEDIVRLELDVKAAQALLSAGGTALTNRFGNLSTTKAASAFKYLNAKSQSTLGLEFGAAFKFPFSNKAQFYTAIGVDVASNIAGAISGAILGGILEQDPVTFGELGATIGDLAGTGIEELIVGAESYVWIGGTVSLPFDYNLAFGGKEKMRYSVDLNDQEELSTVSGRIDSYMPDPNDREAAKSRWTGKANKFGKTNMFSNSNGVFTLYPRYAYTLLSHSSTYCGVLAGAVNGPDHCKQEEFSDLHD